MTEIEVLVELLFIEIIVVHDLKEFFKVVDEVVSSTDFRSSRDKLSKARRAALSKSQTHVLKLDSPSINLDWLGRYAKGSA